MRKSVLVPLLALLLVFSGWFAYRYAQSHTEHEVALNVKSEEEEGGGGGDEDETKEDGIRQAQEQEFEMTKDVKLGYIPKGRLVTAYENLRRLRAAARQGGNQQMTGVNALTWTERGPYTDATGPSSGNPRLNNAVTSGRMRAVWVDLADASNKTVWVGGVDGGIWKTTDITASPATWTLVNDFFGNLAIGSICQDPASTSTMYFGTGEKTFNTDAVRGGGIWKSTDHGVTWNLLPSTTGFWNVSKIICDGSGNVYVTTIGTGNGILRSIDGGSTWSNISPSGLSSNITDMKLSSTGRLHIACGYLENSSSLAAFRYTDNPSTVTSATWTAPVTPIANVQYNTEIACSGNTLYALTATHPTSSTYETPDIYKSTDGGANWAKANSTALPTATNSALSAGQGWYDLALGIDPANPSHVIAGGLNCYYSADGGSTWTQLSVWVAGGSAGTAPNYIHADQHTVVWNGSQVMVSSDGGIFYSSDNGTTFTDRNVGLRLKQFYSCAIHPTTTNYFLAGAQDNGCHQLTSAGLGGSIEVVGGDGAFMHIDQDQPQYQFGAYVYSQYRRSTNGGASWSSVNYSSSIGRFINPTDYDDGNNIMYTGGNAGQYIRWDDPQTGSTFTPVSVGAFSGTSVTAVTVSPYTSNRVFFGTTGGKVVRVDNANSTSPSATAITGGGMSASTVSCVATGTNDNNLLATFSNYGATHVWVSTTGGGSWANISGNLPDIPVRWAMFYPDDDTKAIIATEMGVYETSLINGTSTVWSQDAGFPVVRTNMLQYRKSDGTVAAATHGRGLWTSTIPTNPYIRYQVNYGTHAEATASTSGCRGYTDYTVNMTIDAAPAGDATVTLSVAGGGTATQGIDFDFTTNGNFAAPSNVLTFPNGSTTSQPVTIRVYDDASVESNESFTLNYAVSGTTNAQAAPGNPAYSMTITDNDVAAAVPASSTFTVGSHAGDLSAGMFDARQASNRCQILYKASELTAAGMSAGNISAISFNLTKNSTRPYQNFKINIGTTGISYLISGSFTPVSTATYKTLSSYTTVNGLNTFTLDAPFVWNGTSNIVVEVCYDNSTADASNFVDVPYFYSDGGSGSQGNIFWQDSINCSGSFSSVNGYVNGYKPMALFTLGVIGNPVETTLNASKTAYLGPNKDVYFYNSNGDVIARVTNLSSFDYGCTQVTVDRAGSSSAQFWNNTTANYLMSKTVHVVPTNNNASGQYQITLYYTATEKTGWESATGQSFSNIQLVKVAGQINQVTPATPNAAGTVQIVTPVVGTFGSDYTLTYTFSTGFSGFGAGIPAAALPVTLLSFSGRLDNTVIPLSWATSSEQNSAYFEVQKATDGTSFYPLGRVNAAGNSNSERRYGYTDKQVNELNYYRLKMVDVDGKFAYSNVVLVKGGNVQQQVWVQNNPFHSYIDLRLAKLPQQQVKIELLTISGSLAFSRFYAGGLQVHLDLSSASLSAGTYLLRTTVDGKPFVNKVVKQ